MPPPARWLDCGLLAAETSVLIEETLRRSAGRVEAKDAALWFASESHLIPLIGVGPNADGFLGNFEQPLSEGLVSLVYASGRGLCENAISENPQHSALLDQKLGHRTESMIALPLAVLGRPIGVLSCVHIRPLQSQEPIARFDLGAMAEFEFAAACITRFIEADLLANLS
jgi:hypothetical protein